MNFGRGINFIAAHTLIETGKLMVLLIPIITKIDICRMRGISPARLTSDGKLRRYICLDEKGTSIRVG